MPCAGCRVPRNWLLNYMPDGVASPEDPPPLARDVSFSFPGSGTWVLGVLWFPPHPRARLAPAPTWTRGIRFSIELRARSSKPLLAVADPTPVHVIPYFVRVDLTLRRRWWARATPPCRCPVRESASWLTSRPYTTTSSCPSTRRLSAPPAVTDCGRNRTTWSQRVSRKNASLVESVLLLLASFLFLCHVTFYNKNRTRLHSKLAGWGGLRLTVRSVPASPKTPTLPGSLYKL